MKIISVSALFLLLLGVVFFGCKKDKKTLPESNINYYKVWSEAPHNAFTDMAIFDGRFYLVFREGTDHMSNDGAIRVLKSEDGKNFESVARFEDPLFDLRDPKIINIGDSILYLQYGMADRNQKIFRNGIRWSKDGSNWVDKKTYSYKDAWWLWSICSADHELLSVGYSYYRNDNNNLYRSKKLGEYDQVAKIKTPSFASGETTIASNKDTVFCAIRATNFSLQSYLGYATKKDLSDWKCFPQDPKVILGGPKLFFLPNGKLYLLTRSERASALQTSLFLVDRKTFNLTYILTLPTEGDNGYGGIAFDERNLYISYYSTFDKKAEIFVSKFPLADFN